MWESIVDIYCIEGYLSTGVDWDEHHVDLSCSRGVCWSCVYVDWQGYLCKTHSEGNNAVSWSGSCRPLLRWQQSGLK